MNSDDVPQNIGYKPLDTVVEDLADYLYVNCPGEYETIVAFGRARFRQGVIYKSRELKNETADSS